MKKNTTGHATAATDFNFDWKFLLEDDQKALEVNYNDSNWNAVRLPHDWSVEASFSKEWEGATGYLPGGIGWYRKEFTITESTDSHSAYVLFDGVYNNAEVYLNGQLLGKHPYGYSPFFYDLSEYLNAPGETNIIAVRVDHSRYCDSRWYTGSGIYRNVQLVTVKKLHIPIWGTFVTTPVVSEESATVNAQIDICNQFSNNQVVELTTTIYNQNNEAVSTITDSFEVAAEKTHIANQELIIEKPELWDIDSPVQYKAVTTITSNGEELDAYETTFGIRTIHFDANTGFFLNGKNTIIKGVCLHHDGGLVGAAVPEGVWRRRFEKLKEAGCNAIRIAHNPASEEFLALCDEMGLLVQDEFFDEWDNPKDKRMNQNEQHDDYISRGYTEHFQEWAEEDLKTVMLSHRNHPSIFQWSIGNEIEWTYPRNSVATGYFDNMSWEGNYFWTQPPFSPEEIKRQLDTLPKEKYDIGQTAQKLGKWTRELDTTRPVIANCILPSASHLSGYADALDIIGYSYRRVMYDFCHEHYPNLPIMGTENLAQWHDWKAIYERPHISGTFIWTGIDYMGEVNGQWPTKALACGIIDVAGFEKQSWHMMKAIWSEKPHAHITTQTVDKSPYVYDEATNTIAEENADAWKQKTWIWHDTNNHWNYEADQLIAVEAYTNCDSVELFLNDKSLGEQNLDDYADHIIKWAVPYTEGTLKAVAKKDGEVISTEVITSTEATEIQLSIDKTELAADAYDVAHIIAQLVDSNGNPVTSEECSITFEIEGEVRNLGVDNGAHNSVQDYQANVVTTSKGRAMMIVQSTMTANDVTISAVVDGIPTATTTLRIS